jgi:hypothetical protein
VLSRLSKDIVRYRDELGKISDISSSKTVSYHSSHILPLDNLCDIHFAHEGPVVNLLREKFLGNNIYTYVGNILISINPYAAIENLYDAPFNYLTFDSITKMSARVANAAPHIYSVANSALMDLCDQVRAVKREKRKSSMLRKQSDNNTTNYTPTHLAAQAAMFADLPSVDTDFVDDDDDIVTSAMTTTAAGHGDSGVIARKPSNVALLQRDKDFNNDLLAAFADNNTTSDGYESNVSIIITGDAGAGKTEASKYILNFLINANDFFSRMQSNDHKQSMKHEKATDDHLKVHIMPALLVNSNWILE